MLIESRTSAYKTGPYDPHNVQCRSSFYFPEPPLNQFNSGTDRFPFGVSLSLKTDNYPLDSETKWHLYVPFLIVNILTNFVYIFQYHQYHNVDCLIHSCWMENVGLNTCVFSVFCFWMIKRMSSSCKTHIRLTEKCFTFHNRLILLFVHVLRWCHGFFF